MPGIGPRTGARILAEVGDGSAFATGSKLAAYAGLAPVTRQSGTSLSAETAAAAATTGSRTPCSSPRSRPCATPPPDVLRPQTRRGKRHNAALICLARRRCDVILAMLRTGHPYQPARPAPGLP